MAKTDKKMHIYTINSTLLHPRYYTQSLYFNRLEWLSPVLKESLSKGANKSVSSINISIGLTQDLKKQIMTKASSILKLIPHSLLGIQLHSEMGLNLLAIHILQPNTY